MGKHKICELCGGEAVAYCASDSAFLCLSCDAKVHGANFLVARHVRQIICSNCEDFTGDQICGVGLPVNVPICPFCLSTELGSGELDSLSSSSSSSSSDCVSSVQTSSSSDRVSSVQTSSFRNKKKRGGGTVIREDANHDQRVKWGIDSKTVGILVNWCKRLGVNGRIVSDIIRTARSGLAICGRKLTILPFRVCLVASLWLGLRFSGIKYLSTSQALARLELITGVLAKLIAATESKIERLYRSAMQHQNNKQSRNHTQADHLKEGWAESS